MMKVLHEEGLLGQLAGQSDRNAADSAEEFHIAGSAETARRLNAAQQRLCAVMPL
jgi:hypothetical protein